LHFGFPSITTNEQLRFGVYNFGSVAPEYPQSFGFQYILSHGQLNTSDDEPLEIGCIRGFGDEMYIGWKHGDKYGIDLVDSNSKVSSRLEATMRRFDAKSIHKRKDAHRVVIATTAVPEGTQVRPFYQLDDGAREYGAGEYMQAGSDQAVLTVSGENFRSIQYGLEGTSEDTVTEPLRVRGIALEYSPLSDEDAVDE